MKKIKKETNISQKKRAFEFLLNGYYLNNQIKLSFPILDSLIDIAILENDSIDVLKNSMKMGVLHQMQSNYQMADTFFKMAEAYIQSDTPKVLKSKLFINIANNLSILKKNEAFSYYQEAINTSKKDTNELTNVYLNMMSAYLGSNDLENTRRYKDSTFKYIGFLDSKDREVLHYNSIEFYLKNQMYDSIMPALDNYYGLVEKIYSDKLEKEIFDVKELLASEYELEKKSEKAEQAYQRKKSDFLIAILIGGTFVLALLMLILYINNRRKKAELEKYHADQRLLRSQMNPHFVFNALSGLQTFINYNDKEKATSYLARLSKLLRNILEFSRFSYVSLNEEINMLESYLQLQQMQFQDCFTFLFKIQEGLQLSRIQVAPMLLQPFVENAVRHAFVGMKERGEITIHIEEDNNFLICKIEDNGIGVKESKKIKKADDRKSLSIQIAIERLQNLSKQIRRKASLFIVDKGDIGGQGTLVTIKIPKTKS